MGHLTKHFQGIYMLYLIQKDQRNPPTDDQEAIVAAKQILDPSKASISNKFNDVQWASLKPSRNSRTQWSVLHSCSQVCITLKSMFAGAQLGPRRISKTFSQWVVVCNQPFNKAEKPKFWSLLKYIHLPPLLNIQHWKAVRTCIMKMGEDKVDTIKKMIEAMFFNQIFIHSLMPSDIEM